MSGRDGVVTVDQTAIRGSRRSNPATYTKLLDPIRKAFAKANGVKPGLFSANSDGACPTCNGAGVIYTDLGFMESIATTCEECEGKRFQAEVLEYEFGGKDISEVLAMSVIEAEEFFGDGEASTPAAHKILVRLADVGLGYLSLGQPLTTLSGGERQRLKLATRMGEKGGVYVLDEPTTGLHLADVEQLLGLLDRLVDSGKSVIVIEHHQGVMAHADWIIDLGPGAGHDGGRIVFEGTPADLVAARSTLTGEHLAAYAGSLTLNAETQGPSNGLRAPRAGRWELRRGSVDQRERERPAPRAREHGLARDAREVAGAAGDVEAVVARSEVAADPQVAEAADLTVQVDEDLALDLAMRPLSAAAMIATDPVARVVDLEEVLSEPEAVVGPVRLDGVQDNREVRIERCGCRDHDGDEGCGGHDPSDEQSAHRCSSLSWCQRPPSRAVPAGETSLSRRRIAGQPSSPPAASPLRPAACAGARSRR